MTPVPLIDAVQYSNWSRKIFEQMHSAGIAAVCATICYHETFRETVANIERWRTLFVENADLIVPCGSSSDIRSAINAGKTGIVLALQNCSPIEDDIGLVEILHLLGIRTMQLTYNNQSLLAAGCYEEQDSGLTRFGLQVVTEMNRVGMLIDMSHSGERSTLQAIEKSARPIAITHANPSSWHPSIRNKSPTVLLELARSGGMLGFSIYPHHLNKGPDCSLVEFCEMIARTADLMGLDHLGIGSDLCQDQPDSVVQWMRNGRWTKKLDYGEGSASNPGFPNQPSWFRTNEDFPRISDGLGEVGFSAQETAQIMGGNWLRFFEEAFKAR